MWSGNLGQNRFAVYNTKKLLNNLTNTHNNVLNNLKLLIRLQIFQALENANKRSVESI